MRLINLKIPNVNKNCSLYTS